MDAPVEIRYAGVVVGSATEILRAAGNESGMFLVTADPLPVGTVVKLGDGSFGRVEKVVESTDPRGAGMYVRTVQEAEAGERWVPQLPEMVPLPAPRRSPTPPSVPLVSPRVSEARPTLGENGERRPTILNPPPPERAPGIVLATPPERPAVADRPPTIVVNSEPPPEPPARERRNTWLSANPPPAENGPSVVSAKASGEFQSRAPEATSRGASSADTIVVAAEEDRGEPIVEAPMDNSPSEEVAMEESKPTSLDQLQPARPLPKKGRRRRNTR
jgi:hypothetical protein